MGAMDSRGVRVATGAAIALGISLAAPMACFFPSYTYDLPNGTGGSASTTTGPSTGTGTGMTSTTSTGMGGSSTVTSSTSSSSSSTSGATCASMNCADPQCNGVYACVPTTPPTGWTGYFALYDGSPSSVPSCAGTWPTQAYEGSAKLAFKPASCPCTCGTPSGGTCDIPELDISDAACPGTSGTCTGPVTPPSGYKAGTCFNFPDPGGGYDEFGGNLCGPQQPGHTSCDSGTKPCSVSANVGPGTVSGSSCAPSTTMPDRPPVTWGSTGLACGGATTGTGCGSSDSCMPVPQGPFHSGLCIMQMGVQSCPAVQFTEQHIFYSGTNDTRDCSACTCGAATGDTCTVQWTLYSDTSATPNCQTLVATADSSKCIALSGNPSVTSVKASILVPAHGGSCTPVDGQPSGMVTATGATTFCCIP